jgi:hypothetical protein
LDDSRSSGRGLSSATGVDDGDTGATAKQEVGDTAPGNPCADDNDVLIAHVDQSSSTVSAGPRHGIGALDQSAMIAAASAMR